MLKFKKALLVVKVMGINELYIGGLATDYCVRFSTRDAIKQGFKVKILMDAIKGVNLRTGDCEEAIKEMVKAGGKLITLKDLEAK